MMNNLLGTTAKPIEQPPSGMIIYEVRNNFWYRNTCLPITSPCFQLTQPHQQNQNYSGPES